MKSVGDLYDFGYYLGETVLLDPWENDGVITPFSCCFCMLNDYVGGSESSAAVFYLYWDDTPSGDTACLRCLFCDYNEAFRLRCLTPFEQENQQVVDVSSLGCDVDYTPPLSLAVILDDILGGINDVLGETVLTMDEAIYDDELDNYADMKVLFLVEQQLSDFEA